SISQVSGTSITTTGATTLTSTSAGTGGTFNLGNSGNSFGGAVMVNSGSATALNVTLQNSGSLTVNGTVTGNLKPTGTGINDGSSQLTVGGTTTLAAGTGNIDLEGSAGDSLSGAVSITSGNNATISDVVGLVVSGTVSGAMNLSSTGNIEI